MVLYLASFFVFVISFLVYKLVVRKYDYWKKRNVPYLEPTFLFGNYKDYILQKKFPGTVVQEICRKFPKEPYIGTFYGTEPALLVQDLETLKIVMTKDFYYFSSREIADYTHKEPITNNMFFTYGDKWRVLRQNVTPIFSSSKVKSMFPIIKSCAREFEIFLDNELKMSNSISAKSILVRYAMNCITSCAFGINANAFKDENGINPFVIIGEKIFGASSIRGIKWITRAIWPGIFYAFNLRFFDSDVDNFFDKLMTGVFESRQYKQSSRNDFVDFVLSWYNKNKITGDSLENMIKTEKSEKKAASIEVNKTLLVSQCMLFFAAGFETTASSITYLLFNLAKDKEAQDRVIKEVDDYLARHNGDIEYECVYELPYLEACIDETLRMFPVLAVVTREVIEDYTLPSGLVLEKGMRIHAPVYHIHNNPEYFPEPEKFKPERFLGEAKQNIEPYTFMPFGKGPRSCIGMRFAKMPMYTGLINMFKKFHVELADGVPENLTFLPTAIVTQSVEDVRLKFVPRQ